MRGSHATGDGMSRDSTFNSFILLIYMLYRTYFFISCKVHFKLNVVPTRQYAISDTAIVFLCEDFVLPEVSPNGRASQSA